MEILHTIDTFLLGLWVELKEGVGVRVPRLSGKHDNGFIV